VYDKYSSIWDEMRKFYLPSHSHKTLFDDDPLHKLACRLMNCYGLALTDLIESADKNFQANKVTHADRIQGMHWIGTFSLNDHRATIIKVNAELKKQKKLEHKDILMKILEIH
jgi:aspartokinase-like uncharacterized kinase